MSRAAEAQGTRSRDLFKRAAASLPGGNSRDSLYVPPFPPYARSGSGYELTDEDGHVVIDLHANATSLIHGHAHPTLVDTAAATAADGTCFGLPTKHEIELAELLTGRFRSIDLLRFTNSGSEAVMMAVRGARAFTGRHRVVRFEGCYHGATDDLVFDSDSPSWCSSDSVVLPLDDQEGFSTAIRDLGSEIACVIIDLLPNRRGFVPFNEEFARLVRQETEARGIALIVDEVITSRLGLEGLQGEYGIEPDLTALGKVIGGGYPIGAFGGRAEIMEQFDPTRSDYLPHAGTFSANPISTSAGLASMKMLDASAIARIDSLGELLRDGLGRLGYRVTGRGSLLRVHGLPEGFWRQLYQCGVLTTPQGACAVSTVMNEDAVARALEAFESAR